jgi:hypothetical protein
LLGLCAKILTRQQRVTANFTQDDGHSLHVRKSTLASPQFQEIYDAPGISASPGGIKNDRQLTVDSLTFKCSAAPFFLMTQQIDHIKVFFLWLLNSG